MTSTGLRPCEMRRHVYLPGANPYVFHIEMKGEALKAVGVLEQITSLFSAQRIPILQFGVTGIGENLMLTIFADVGDEKTAAKVVEDIRKTPYALQVWYSKPIVKGFCYDNFCFPPTIEGERAIILSKPYYEGFITEGWSRFGTAFPIMLYLLGFEAGRRAYRDFAYIAGGDRDAEVKVAQSFFQMLGYGRLESVKLDDRKREAVVRVYDSFECSLFLGVGEIRAGFARGLIGGWLAARWGVEKAENMVVREEKCIAKGDPYCEFRVWIEEKR